MIFNEIKCHFTTSLGLVGGCILCIPSVSAPEYNIPDTRLFIVWLR